MRIALTFLFAAAMVGGCSRSNTLPPDGLPTDVGPAAAADKKQFQGIWAVESVEAADPKDKPPADQISGVRFIFEGNTFRIYEKGRTFQDRFAFALDTTVDPKAVILTELDDTDQPIRLANTMRYGPTAVSRTTGAVGTAYSTSRGSDVYSSVTRIEWIYKFDGENLVLAFRRGMSEKRPTSFKPEAGVDPRRGSTRKAGEIEPNQQGAAPTFVVRLKRVDEPVPPVVKRPNYGTRLATSYGTNRGGYTTRPYPAGTYKSSTKK